MGHGAPPLTCIIQEVQESKPHTIVNLQGIVNCKYVVQFAKSQQPKRTVTAHTWPPSAEVNMQRLESAGFMEDRHLSKCINCGGEYRSSEQADA